MRSLVVVLPAEPETAITRAATDFRHQCAIWPKANNKEKLTGTPAAPHFARLRQSRKVDAIEGFVETKGAKATTDSGFLELDMWFDGPHQKAITACEAAKRRKTKRKAKR